MADVVNDGIDSVSNAGRGVWGGIKSTFNGVARVIKPLALTATVLTASALMDGGISALANLSGPAGAMDMLQVPLEGFKELTAGVGEVGQWLSGQSAEVAASPMLN